MENSSILYEHQNAVSVMGSFLDDDGEVFLNLAKRFEGHHLELAKLTLQADFTLTDTIFKLGYVPFLNNEDIDFIAAHLDSNDFQNAIAFENGIVIPTSKRGVKLTLWIITNELLNDVVDDLTHPAKIPKSEMRLLKQLISGYSLVEAAKLDKLGYETKKGYYKLLTAKLNVNSQTQLIAKVLPALMEVAQEEIHKTHATSDTQHLRAVHSGANFFGIFNKSGHQDWILEYGPEDGTPILWFSQQALTPFQKYELNVLKKLGWRVLIPVRPGMLQPHEKRISKEDYLSRIMQSALQASMLCGDAPVDIIGSISGSIYAIEFCKRHPERTKSLRLFGAYGHSHNIIKMAGRFRSAAIALALKQPIIIETIFDYLAKKLDKPKEAQKFFLKLYGDSKPDRELIIKELAKENASKGLIDIFRTSKRSIEMDFKLLQTFNWDELSNINIPKFLAYGAEDTLVSKKQCSDYALRTGSEYHIIEGCGQLAFDQSFASVMTVFDKWHKNLNHPLIGG